jgi:hypothetical protein
MRIRIKLANELFAIFTGLLLEVHDEGFDLFSACPAERVSLAEVDGIGLDQIRLEVVLTDEQTEFVTQPRLTIAGAILGL